jgi:hypothetical protein
MLNQRLNGSILEDQAVEIIKYMYNTEDSEILLSKIR